MRGNRTKRSEESRALTSKSTLAAWRQRRERVAQKAKDEVISVYDVTYKIGAHGFVFYLLDGEWIKSGITPDRLMQQHRMAQNEQMEKMQHMQK